MFTHLFFLQWILWAGAAKSAAALSKKEAKVSNYAQQLVFGSDRTDRGKKHWCDVKLTPSRTVQLVVIYVKTGKKDGAVPTREVIPRKSKTLLSGFRVEIPGDLAKENIQYTFQFQFDNDDHIFSEAWAYDPERGEFCLISAIKKSFLKSTAGMVIIGATVALLSIVGMYFMLRACRKSKATM